MTARTPFALASLALVLATPLAAADTPAEVPGNRYVVVNQTDAALTCRYRVISGNMGVMRANRWQDYPAIAAGAAFNQTARGPDESINLDCNSGGSPSTVRPGARYNATKADGGKVVVTRVRN